MLWHAFLCVCTARTTMPAPRGCLRRCWRINLPPCEKMCPSTQDLLRVRGVRAVSPLPSRLALSLPAPIASPSRCTALASFYKQPWLHHVAAFIWSEMLPAALPRGRGTLRAFSGPSGDNNLPAGVTHGGRRCSENISFWWDVEGEVTFPQRLLETGRPFPRQRVKDGEVPFRQVEHIPRNFYTLWTKLQGGLFFQGAIDLLDLGPGSFPSDAIKILRSAVQTSQPPVWTHPRISSESSSLFSDCICKSKGLLSYPLNDPAMQTITSKWECIYTK